MRRVNVLQNIASSLATLPLHTMPVSLLNAGSSLGPSSPTRHTTILTHCDACILALRKPRQEDSDLPCLDKGEVPLPASLPLSLHPSLPPASRISYLKHFERSNFREQGLFGP